MLSYTCICYGANKEESTCQRVEEQHLSSTIAWKNFLGSMKRSIGYVIRFSMDFTSLSMENECLQTTRRSLLFLVPVSGERRHAFHRLCSFFPRFSEVHIQPKEEEEDQLLKLKGLTTEGRMIGHSGALSGLANSINRYGIKKSIHRREDIIEIFDLIHYGNDPFKHVPLSSSLYGSEWFQEYTKAVFLEFIKGSNHVDEIIITRLSRYMNLEIFPKLILVGPKESVSSAEKEYSEEKKLFEEEEIPRKEEREINLGE